MAVEERAKDVDEVLKKPRKVLRVRATPADTEARVIEIANMMASMTWRAGDSHRALAERWGLGVDHVMTLAAEASRYIKRLAGTDEEIRQEILLGIQRTGEEARTAEDHGNVLKAYELRAKLHGLLVQKHEVTAKDFASLTREQKMAELEKTVLELEAAKKELGE